MATKAFAVRTILVPVDFSECCLAGAEYAASLARTLHATLRLFHVTYPYVDYVFVDRAGARLSGLIEAVQEAARQHMDALKETEFLHGLPVQTEIRPGHAIHQICRAASHQMLISSSLRVMGAQDSSMRSSEASPNMWSVTPSARS